MLDLLSTIGWFIVAVSILVAVHEYGHFWVARRLGFKVLRFSIGFGRPLAKWTAGGEDRVEYWLSALPLGGYVKLLDEREGPVDAADRERAFNRRPVPHRVAVLLAGPIANFLFAIVAYWGMFLLGVPGTLPVVGGVIDDSVAARAGLEARDRLLAVGGREVPSWEDATFSILDELLGGGEIELLVEKADGARESVVLDVRGRESELTQPDALFAGLGIRRLPPLPADIGDVVPGSAAEGAGIRSGDRVVGAGAQPIPSWEAFVAFIRARPGAAVTLTVERDGERVDLPITIPSVDEDGESVGRIGVFQSREIPADVVQGLSVERRFGPLEAIGQATARLWAMSALTVRMLGRMVIGDVSVRNMSGPITIADFAGQSAQLGLSYFLSFLGIVSISLGILNLLPIPLLDGGQIVYQLAELVKGTPLSEKALLLGQQIGLLFIIVLTSFVIYNDLTRVFG
jgi:regulator of sigma E protease